MIEISVPFPPTPWQAPKRSGRMFYDSKEPEKRAVRFFIRAAYSYNPLTDYTALEFKFIFKPPSSASNKKKDQMLAGEIIPTRCDCTNLQKLYEDCLKGIVIDDDRKVAKIFSEKIYGEKDEVRIRVFTLEEYNNAHCIRRM